MQHLICSAAADPPSLLSPTRQFFLITFLTFLLVPWTIYTLKPKSAAAPAAWVPSINSIARG
jgi:hypothetical protein